MKTLLMTKARLKIIFFTDYICKLQNLWIIS